YVINQMSGPTVDTAKLLEAQHAVGDAAQAKAYLARLAALPGMLDGALARMKHDVALGVIPPDFIIDASRITADAFVQGKAADNVLDARLRSKHDKAKVPRAARFAAHAEKLDAKSVLPPSRGISAYHAAVRPPAPHDAANWRLPNGDK